MNICTQTICQQRVSRYRRKSSSRMMEQGRVLQKQSTTEQPLTRRASRRTVTMDQQPCPPPSRSNAPAPKTTPLPREKQHSTSTSVGLGMITMLLILWVITAFIVPWISGISHRWDCGSGNVCSTQVSLFKPGQRDEVLSFDVTGSVNVIIAPGGSFQQAKIYVIETNVTPGKYITVTAGDVNNDHLTDLSVSVEGEAVQHSLINRGDGNFSVDAMQK